MINCHLHVILFSSVFIFAITNISVLQQQQILGRRFGTSKMHLSPPPHPPPPPPGWLRLLSILLLLTCLLSLPRWESVIVLFFDCTLLYVPSSFATILMRKGELVALFKLSSWCLVIVVWLFLAVPWVCLQFVTVVFPDCTNVLFFSYCVRFLFAMILNLLVNRLKRNFCQVCIMG